MGIVWSGCAAECMMSIYLGSSGVVHTSAHGTGMGHVVRLALSEGSPGGAMFGNNLRQEAAYQKEEASAKGGKGGWASGPRLVEEESGLHGLTRGGAGGA